ncbi:hypothetical protein AB0A95_13810 [Micromonospora sp. NPDC049230]|uniref:hypothetical protein n=1 Tax=Micromonospora sp. NPDC049230 TaxID=3155502 RepID=UPI0033E5E7AF
MATEEHRQRGWRKLARDAGVNVVANLIAAAIIYLLAVAAGYLNANRKIIAGLLTIPVILVIVGAILYIGFVAPRWGRWQWLVVPLVLLLMSAAVLGLGYLRSWADPDLF